jgi:hypothetical protein
MPEPTSSTSPGAAAIHGPPPSGGSARGPGGGRSFSEVLRSGAEGGAGAPEAVPPGLALLRGAARSIGRGERLIDQAVRAARRGHVFGHAELLALQAGVYRHSQELDLASKLVDKGTSAVRNVLSSQQ